MREAQERDEFRTPVSPEGIGFFQITARENQTGRLGGLYNAKWTPDSRRFLVVREPADDGSAPGGLWVCDTADKFALSPVLEFKDGTDGCRPALGHGDNLGAELIPDGSGVAQIVHVGDRFELRVTTLDGSRTETVVSSPATLATRWMSVSGDSERVAFGVFLGDGKTEGAPWGTRVFDLRKRTWWDIELGNQFRRAPGEYTYSPDPALSHFLVTSMPRERLSDGSWLTPPDGVWRWQNMPPADPLGGADLVYHDVTGKWGIIPLGRNGSHISSHATWRGRAFSWVAAMYHTGPGFWRAPFVEAAPLACGPERYFDGATVPGVRPVDLSRRQSRADACHFGFDAAGRHLVSDTDGYVNPGPNLLYVATYVDPPGEDPYLRTKLLGITRTSWRWKGTGTVQASHPHPNLSPDGRFAIFQSDFTGRPQVHLACDFDFP